VHEHLRLVSELPRLDACDNYSGERARVLRKEAISQRPVSTHGGLVHLLVECIPQGTTFFDSRQKAQNSGRSSADTPHRLVTAASACDW
jgi:hypothetical protein